MYYFEDVVNVATFNSTLNISNDGVITIHQNHGVHEISLLGTDFTILVNVIQHISHTEDDLYMFNNFMYENYRIPPFINLHGDLVYPEDWSYYELETSSNTISLSPGYIHVDTFSDEIAMVNIRSICSGVTAGFRLHTRPRTELGNVESTMCFQIFNHLQISMMFYTLS